MAVIRLARTKFQILTDQCLPVSRLKPVEVISEREQIHLT